MPGDVLDVSPVKQARGEEKTRPSWSERQLAGRARIADNCHLASLIVLPCRPR